MRTKVTEKNKVKEMEYVPRVSRKGKPTFSLRSVSPSPPPITPSPSPSKSRPSTRGFESPSKRPRIYSPTPNEGGPEEPFEYGRYTKVRCGLIMALYL